MTSIRDAVCGCAGSWMSVSPRSFIPSAPAVPAAGQAAPGSAARGGPSAPCGKWGAGLQDSSREPDRWSPRAISLVCAVRASAWLPVPVENQTFLRGK